MGWPYQQKPPMGWPLDYDSGLADFVGAWFFLEGSGNKVQDLSGNGNTGAFQGDPTWIAGKFGPALDFDGTGDYVQSVNNIGISGSQNRTISIWFKISVEENYPTLISWGTTAAYKEFSLVFQDDSQFRIAIDSGNRIWNQAYGDNIWHYLAIVLDGTKTSDLIAYCDGSVCAVATTNDQTINTTDSKVRIGRPVGAYDYFTSQIDLPMIFNRALSASEIGKLYREPFCMFKDPAEIALLGGYQAVIGNAGIMTTNAGYWGPMF